MGYYRVIQEVFIGMKIWKILESMKTIAYVQVLDSCVIFDTAYAALELVRKQFPENKKIDGIQLLDIKSGEQMEEGIPVFALK